MDTWMNIRSVGSDVYGTRSQHWRTHITLGGSLSDEQKQSMKYTNKMFVYVIDNMNDPERFDADLNTKDMRI